MLKARCIGRWIWEIASPLATDGHGRSDEGVL